MGALASRLTGRRYRLVAALAKGGMGEVFVGRETGPKAPASTPLVAIKTMLPDVAQDGGMLSRFLDEAQISARLAHPNIARMLDFGEAAGRPFAVFELLQGEDLAHLIDDAIDNRRELPVDAVLAFGASVARALHHAHGLQKDGRPLNVVHRDLSPSNLFLTRDGTARVLDFGAAIASERQARTATGMIIGKLEYMAPEQVKGEPLGPYTDVYALGLCLYEALTLTRALHDADEQAKIRKIFDAEMQPMHALRRGIPAGVQRTIERACSARAKDRPQTALELAVALEAELGKLTDASPQALLTGLFDALVGQARADAKAQRLATLAARPEPADDLPFQWDAPALAPEGAPQAALSVESAQIEGAQPAAAEPATDRAPRPELPATKVERPRAPRADPAADPNAKRVARRRLAYALAAGALVAALGLGYVLGQLAAK